MTDPLEQLLTRIATEQAGGRKLYTADEVTDMLLDVKQAQAAAVEAKVRARL